MIDFSSYQFTVTERFLRYVRIDTQSDETSDTFPSTKKQKNLSRLLVQELQDLWLWDAYLDQYGYVYATLPSNSDKVVTPIWFCSHVDVSPGAPSENVEPIIHKKYHGGRIKLPKNDIILSPEENPELQSMLWYDIITSDGSTLLWADDKAWIAEIMDMLTYLTQHPEIRHGDIKICFTPDEEIWRWVDTINLDEFTPTYCYTVDGWGRGDLEVATFSADKVTITFEWINIHPGSAKDRLVNSMKVCGYFLQLLPQALSPEATEWEQWFFHPTSMQWRVDTTTISFILRSFQTDELDTYAELLESLAQQASEAYPGSTWSVERTEQYRNMREVLQSHPHLKEYAEEAMHRADIEPITRPIRWWTDGSRLTFMGIPTPNLFAGGHNFHSVKEFIAIQDMQAAVKVLVHLATIREEKA